jgi:hypothetical protein
MTGSLRLYTICAFVMSFEREICRPSNKISPRFLQGFSRFLQDFSDQRNRNEMAKNSVYDGAQYTLLVI